MYIVLVIGETLANYNRYMNFILGSATNDGDWIVRKGQGYTRINSTEYRYVTGPMQLRGYMPERIVVLNSAMFRKDWNQIADEIVMREAAVGRQITERPLFL